MTVKELIDKLSNIKEKRQRVVFLGKEYAFDISLVSELLTDGEEVLDESEWSDIPNDDVKTISFFENVVVLQGDRQ